MSTRPHPLDQVGIRFGIAGAGLLAALLAAGLAGLADGATFGLILVASAGLGATVSRGYAALLGLTAWALVTGFVSNDYGQLTFARPDLELMAALVGLTFLTSHLAAVAKAERHTTSHRSLT